MSTRTAARLGKWPFGSVLVVLAGLCLSAGAGCGGLAAQGKNAEGVRLFDQVRYQEAIQQFHEATNNDPKSADGYYNLASAHYRLGVREGDESELKQADHYYRMCLDRDPDHRECYRGLAVLLVNQGRSDEALQLVQDWVDRQPGLAAPKIELARLYEESGDVEAAKTHLLEALAVDHENARALAALGKLREQTGETVQALADYQRSLWHDRFQPEVAARAGALKAALNPTAMMTAPAGDTQVATGGSTLIR